MRDIPVWLLVLVGTVGVLALSLLVYVLLPPKSGVREPAAPGLPPDPDQAAEPRDVATPGPPAMPPDTPGGAATGEPVSEPGPRHAVTPPGRGAEMPDQTVESPALAGGLPPPMVPEQSQGRHALPVERPQPAALVHDRVANAAGPPESTVPVPVEAHAATPTIAVPSPLEHLPGLEPTYARAARYVGPLMAAASSEPIEALRNGSAPTAWVGPAEPEPDDAAAGWAPHETDARNGAAADHWEPPAVPTEVAPPSQETLAFWAARAAVAEPRTSPATDVAAGSSELFEPSQPPDPACGGFGPATAPPGAADLGPSAQAVQHVDASPADSSPHELVDVASQEPPPAQTPNPTPPMGMGTDPAMSVIGGHEPLALTDAVAQAQPSAADALPSHPDSSYPNSAPPGPNGSPPSEGYTIKGNEGSHRFHTPDSPFYVRTRADVWFCTAEDAERAGFRPWNQGRR